MAAVDKARTRMKADQLDVLQMYWWDYDKANYVDMMSNAQALIRSSRSPPLKGIGVTGFDRRHLTEVVDAGVDIVTAQVSFSLIDTRPLEGGVTRYCAANRIGLLCHGSLLGGFLRSAMSPRQVNSFHFLTTQGFFLRVVRALGFSFCARA